MNTNLASLKKSQRIQCKHQRKSGRLPPSHNRNLEFPLPPRPAKLAGKCEATCFFRILFLFCIFRFVRYIRVHCLPAASAWLVASCFWQWFKWKKKNAAKEKKIQLAIFVALLLNVDSPRPILA